MLTITVPPVVRFTTITRYEAAPATGVHAIVGRWLLIRDSGATIDGTASSSSEVVTKTFVVIP